MLVVRASIQPKFDSSRDPRLFFGQPLIDSVAFKEPDLYKMGQRGITQNKSDYPSPKDCRQGN